MQPKLKKVLTFLLCFLLCFEQSGFAQMAGQLDISAHLAGLRNAFAPDIFRPLHLRYLSYNPLENNFQLFLDKGSLKNPNPQELEDTTKTLLNYFFIGITLPNDTFWVNLRPDAEDKIIDDRLAQTDVGKIMLETDLQLKKDTAKFTSPETSEGREYWDKLYKKAEEIFGSSSITIPTLTRPWIVPDEIIISETPDSGYIYKATLKVMLEQDYLKGSAVYSFKDERLKELNEYSSQLIREIIIPRLTKEINSSKRYASLRQVYYSLIMAQWFKTKFQGEQGKYYELINSRNLQNLNSKEPWSKTFYFKEYQKSFQQGEYNIQEPVYTPTGQVIRSYFSGGMQIMPKVFPQSVGQEIFDSETGTHINRIPRASSSLVKPNTVIDLEAQTTDTIGELGEVRIERKATDTYISKSSSPVEPSKQKALSQLNQFTDAIRQGKYQQGAVVNLRNLPPGVEVILVGDLHSRLDNLKKILNENNNLSKIQRGEAILVILGDAVHSEHALAKMDSSVEIIQFIMDLKIQNPDNVYYVLGNHDYFSPLFSKGDVMQGMVYRDKLKELYGEDYIAAYENFIKVSPLMVMGNGFIAIHGGPIKGASLGEIQNVDVADERNPIVHQAEWGRYNDSRSPSPYYDRDVREFLESMGQPEAQLIVGHSPRRDGNWHWQLLPNHHIIFAGHDRAGYAVVQNGNVNFIEVTGDSAQLELGKNQGEEKIPIKDELVPKPEQLKQTGAIDLKLQQRVEINYSESGSIHIVLAPGTRSEVKLGVYNYEDLPARSKNLGLNPKVGYFIVEESSGIPLESVGFKGLRDGETVDIGRNNPGRFTLNMLISRNHIRIQRRGNAIILEDLNPTNGTIIELNESQGQSFDKPEGDVQDKFGSEKKDNFINNVAGEIRDALESGDIRTVVYLMERVIVHNQPKAKPDSNVIDSAVKDTAQYLENKIGSTDKIREMTLEEFIEAIGVFEVDIGIGMFTLDGASAELVKRVRELAGGADILWDKVQEATRYMAPESIPLIVWLFHPSVQKEGIYYSPAAYRELGISSTKSVFFHELLEKKFVERGAIDSDFYYFFKHAHPRILEEELKFASEIGESETRIKAWRGQIEKIKDLIKLDPKKEIGEEYIRHIEKVLNLWGVSPQDESSSKPSEPNIKVLGGQRSGGTLNTVFTGNVWITAGSFAYKISVVGDTIYFQRYEKDKVNPVGRVHTMSLGQEIQVGREIGDYRLPGDEFLSRKHLIVKISGKERDKFSLFVEDLNSLNGTIVEWNNASSSPISISDDTKMGGIDFRSLPIVTQAIGNLSANISSSSLHNLVSINLNEEWLQIERMASSGIIPSSERIKEYIQTSCAQDNITQDRDKILLCISDILRLEEERCDHTNPTLRDILVVLESMSNTQELRQVFLGNG